MLLDYKLKVNVNGLVETIPFERPFISKNGKVLTCYVPNEYNIKEGETLMLQISDREVVNVIPSIENVIIQGYTDIETPFDVLKIDQREAPILYYILWTNGLLIKCEEVQENNSIYVNYEGQRGEIIHLGLDNHIKLLFKVPYYIENNVLVYQGQHYEMEQDEKGILPIQTISSLNLTLYVNHSSKSQWYHMQKLTFVLPYDTVLPIDEMRLGKIEHFIKIDDEKYIFKKKWATMGSIVYNDVTYYVNELPLVGPITSVDKNQYYFEVIEDEYVEIPDGLITGFSENYVYGITRYYLNNNNQIEVGGRNYDVNKYDCISIWESISNNNEELFAFERFYLVQTDENGSYVEIIKDEKIYTDASVSGQYYSLNYNGKVYNTNPVNDFNINNNTYGINILGVDYPIDTEYVYGNNGDVLFINIDNEKINDILYPSFILAECLESYIETYTYNPQDNFILIHGSKYNVQEVQLINKNGEKELFHISGTTYATQMNDGVIEYFNINEDDASSFYPTIDKTNTLNETDNENENFITVNNLINKKESNENKESDSSELTNDGFKLIHQIYPIIKKYKVTVDGIDYYSENYLMNLSDIGENDINIVFNILQKPTYTLEIENFIHPNILICSVLIGTDNAQTNSEILNRKQIVHKQIINNKQAFIFKKPSVRLAENKDNPINFNCMFNPTTEEPSLEESLPTIVITRKKNDLNIPLQLYNIHGTNLNQEINVQDKFYQEQKNIHINEYVDMEKDIYYPSRWNKNEQKFTNIDKIEFLIHLRTRDENWEIKEDTLSSFKESFEGYSDFTLASDSNGQFSKNSWNIFDYYLDDTTIEKKIDGIEYYQPSDLLGFLDFTDNDVYYQKSKVGKTFLRLSFYDTKNPRTQSLLGTSTIFLETSTLFGKFSTLMVNPLSDVKYGNPKKWSSRSAYVGCGLEPIEGKSLPESKINFNDDLRMSSTFSVDNKLATTSSAEGFYLYIFKEYSQGLHERTIYMKVQLNHAGHGTVIDLFQPTDWDGSLLDLSIESNRNYLKKGLPLQELYNQLYIPIKVIYDFDTKRYCWYLPDDLCKYNTEEGVMKFNLYEIKISS